MDDARSTARARLVQLLNEGAEKLDVAIRRWHESHEVSLVPDEGDWAKAVVSISLMPASDLMLRDLSCNTRLHGIPAALWCCRPQTQTTLQTNRQTGTNCLARFPRGVNWEMMCSKAAARLPPRK